MVYLHIGEPKCGTTYLQEIAWANRAVLRGQGIELPGGNQPAVARAVQDLRGVPASPGDPDGALVGEWAALARQTMRVPRAALISQEHLCGATSGQLRRALNDLADAEVHLILTVRDFASLLPAEWQETIKHRNGRPWRRWLDDVLVSERRDPDGDDAKWFWRAHNTPATLTRWAADIPPERVHVITMPATRTDPTLLWERFAGVIGVDPASVNTARARANAALGLVETELLRRLNLRLSPDIPKWFYAREVKGHLAHELLAERPPGARPQLPPKYLDWAVERSEQVADQLAHSEWHIVGDLDEIRSRPPADGAAKPMPVATDADVLDAALDTLAMLMRDQYQGHGHSARAPAGSVERLAAHPRARRLAMKLRARYPILARAGAWARPRAPHETRVGKAQ